MPTHALKLKHPIVLVHGLGAKGYFGPVDYFYGIPKRLREAGNRIFIANLTAFHTIEHRAKELKSQIEKAFPEEKVNLIGHSFGGLDARYLAAQQDFTEHAASVTTIGTPNRGSIILDIAVGMVPEATFKVTDQVLKVLNSSTKAYQQITSSYCTEVLPTHAPVMPDVGYFSATSVIQNPVMRTALPLFWLPHRIVHRYEGDNDGFVSVHSSRWGEHICTYVGDHYGQIGHFFGFSRGLDHYRFFDEIVKHLKKRGF
ncbi:MAG: alpha/beta fold hydrolase [Bdellovibrionota bacterium]